MKELKDFFQDKQIDKILDIGTGSGDFLKVLKVVFPDAKITGVDPNTEALTKAKEDFPEIIFQEMHVEELKFKDNSFEAVSISMALHHLRDIKKSFWEMKRVVQPGGWIIVSELYSDNLNMAQEVHKMFHHFRSKTDRILGISHNKTFKKREIINMVEEAGIKIKFHFDFNQETNLISNSEELEERVEKMKQMLERIKEYPEYEKLKPKIKEFRIKASKYGFQPATRVVIVGKLE